MRSLSTVLTGVALLAGVSSLPASAQSFSDTLCPRATPKVVAYKAATDTKDPAKIAAAARDAAEAYQLCVSEGQVNYPIEPTVNYDKTQAAMYLFAEGRALAVAGDVKNAVAPLQTSRKLADDVVEWQPQSQSFYASNGSEGDSAAHNSDRNGSRYRGSATDIRNADDQFLARLGVAPPPAAVPAASPAPH